MAATNSTTDVIVANDTSNGSMMRMFKSDDWKKHQDDDDDDDEPMYAFEKDDPEYKPNDDESEGDSDDEEDEKLRSTRTTKKSDKKKKAARSPLPDDILDRILDKCNQHNDSITSEKRNEMMSAIVELPDPSVVSADDLPPNLQKGLAKSMSEQGLLAQGIPPTNWFSGDTERERKMNRGVWLYEKHTEGVAGHYEIESIQAGTFSCNFCPAIIKAMQKNNKRMSTCHLLTHDKKCQLGKTHKERGEDACAICDEAWSVLRPQVIQNVNLDRAKHSQRCLSEADFNSTISAIRTLVNLVPDLPDKIATGSVGIKKSAYKVESLRTWNESSGTNLPFLPPKGEALTSEYLKWYSVPSNLDKLYSFAKRSTGRDELSIPLAGRRARTLQELYPKNEDFPYDREKYSSSKSKKSSSKRSNSAIQSTTSTSSTTTTRSGRTSRNSSGRTTRSGCTAVPTKLCKIDDEGTAKLPYLTGQCMECARECIREERLLERCQWCKSWVCEECILEYDCLHCPHWGKSLSDPTPPHPNPNPYVHGLY